jgi:hypothetical protein
MDILPVSNAYAATQVNDLNGVNPPVSDQTDTNGMAWSGMSARDIAAQTRAMERASGLGNRIDLYA